MAKKNKEICKECKREMEIGWSGEIVNFPVWHCPEHGPGKNLWQEWWDKYSSRWTKKENWLNKADKPSCIIGYFCYLYNKNYNTMFTLDVRTPNPYKSKDFTMARRLLALFKDDALEAKIYLKWAFKYKTKEKTYRVTSLGFFVNSAFVNEYFLAKNQAQKLTRASKLPKDFLNWCQKNYKKIFDKHQFETWGNLNSLVSYVKKYGTENDEGKVVQEAVSRNMLKNPFTYRELEE